MDQNRPNSRRHFLVKSAALIPAASALAACSINESTAAASAPPDAAAADGANVTLESYHPAYFNSDEWAFIKAAVDRLIPSDETGPGALELNVPVFIDKQMDTGFGHASHWYTQGPFKPDAPALWGYQGPMNPRDLYRTAIAAIDGRCKSSFSGRKFFELTVDQQEQLLQDIDSGKLVLEEVPVKDFFTFLLQNTKEGYLADPMYGGNKDAAAWKMIGFPGARADFLDFVGQNKVYPLAPVTINGAFMRDAKPGPKA